MKPTYRIYFTNGHPPETVQADMVTFAFPGFVVFAELPDPEDKIQHPKLAAAFKATEVEKVWRLGDTSGAAIH